MYVLKLKRLLFMENRASLHSWSYQVFLSGFYHTFSSTSPFYLRWKKKKEALLTISCFSWMGQTTNSKSCWSYCYNCSVLYLWRDVVISGQLFSKHPSSRVTPCWWTNKRHKAMKLHVLKKLLVALQCLETQFQLHKFGSIFLLINASLLPYQRSVTSCYSSV